MAAPSQREINASDLQRTGLDDLYLTNHPNFEISTTKSVRGRMTPSMKRYPGEAELNASGIMRYQALHSTIAVAATPSPKVLRSSRLLGWNCISVEQHINMPGLPRGAVLDGPVAIMLRSASSHYEYKDGTGAFASNRVTYGAISVFPPGPVPEIRLLTQSEFAYCAFDSDFVTQIAREMKGSISSDMGIITNKQDAQLQDIFNLFLAELEAQSVKQQLYIDSLACAFVIRVLKLTSAGLGGSTTLRRLPRDAKLDRVKERVDAELGRQLTLKCLADECGYSRAYFLRWFHAQTGLRPHEYVLNRRLERAARLLGLKKMTLTDIAAECGFSSQSHLTSVFRKRFGLPPGAYRRELGY